MKPFPDQEARDMGFSATVIQCQEWGALPPTVPAFSRTFPKWVVVHHTHEEKPTYDCSSGTRSGAIDLARRIQNDHMRNRGWSDTGQNFLISTGGFVLEGRHGTVDAVKAGRCVRSAHAPQSPGRLAGGNDSPGIKAEGNFTTEAMEPVQWASLVELCASLCDVLKLKPTSIKGHRDFTDTTCPGDWLYAQLPQLRIAVAERMHVPLSEAEAANR
jgi:hypothetical protein